MSASMEAVIQAVGRPGEASKRVADLLAGRSFTGRWTG